MFRWAIMKAFEVEPDATPNLNSLIKDLDRAWFSLVDEGKIQLDNKEK